MDAWNPNYEFPEGWVEGLMENPMLKGGGSGGSGGAMTRGEPDSMISLGGGPGFDYVGATLATSFRSRTTTPDDELTSRGA